MSETPDSWAGRLAAASLPPMRRTLTRVRDLLASPRASHTALAALIGSDPGLSLHIFRRLGSLPNQPKEPVCKIESAVRLLGMHNIEQAARSLPSLEDRLAGPARRGLLSCYSRAAHAAIYAAELASATGLPDPQEIASAALLHDLGEMALWLTEPALIRSINQQLRQGAQREQACRDLLGFPMEALDHALGRHWGLPASIQAAQDLTNSHLRQPLLVMLASAFARSSSLGGQRQDKTETVELLADYHSGQIARMQARMHQLMAQAARQLQGLGLPLPAFQAPLAALPAGRKRRVHTAAAGPAKTRQRPAGNENRPIPQVPPSTAFEAKAKTPFTATATKNPLQEKLLLTIKGMKAEQGLDNVMFAMLSKDKQRLKARYVVEQSHQPRLKGFEIDLGRPSLFTALMKKPQAFWLNAGNLVKYLPMIPEENIQSLNAQGFISMSIFVRDRPVGLFYADNGSGNLTPDQFANFKVLCQRFAQQLT